MHNQQKSDAQETSQNNSVAQRQAQPGAKSTKEGQKSPIQAKQKIIQAKQRPIQAKQQPIQAKQRPVQRNTGSSSSGGNTNEAQVKANVSALMGTDVSDAKVHYNSNKPAQLQAEATAQGNQVHIAPGKEQHLGHELTHIAQQKQGRVQANFQANNGVGINNDPKLEKEADNIGAQAQSGKPIQTKTITSGKQTTGKNDAPVQLKLRPGKINGPELVGVHKSNYKKYTSQVLYFLKKAPKQIVVKDETKANLKHGQHIQYDPQLKDATGKYVKVRYTVGTTTKIGFVEEKYIERVLTSKEERQRTRSRKKNQKVTTIPSIQEQLRKQRKAEEKLRKQRKAEEKFKKQQIAQEKEELPIHLRDEANVGVEVEINNIILTRNDNTNWDDDGEPVTLTNGGDHGVWVTDQHSQDKAIIEWNSNHPKFKESNFGGDFQKKLDRLYSILRSNPVGTFADLVNLTSGIMDVGSVVSKYKDVGYDFTARYKTMTQVNMEVPLKNIGKIPLPEKDKKHDSEHMFSGNRSKNSKEIFKQSRKYANELTQEMLAEWNNDHPTQIYQNNQMETLTSTLTIFLHTSIINGSGDSKDLQGVLFKTGAGDLVRAALTPQEKKVLWHAFHESSTDHITKIAERGTEIFQKATGKMGSSLEIDIHNSIYDDARAAFVIKDVYAIEPKMLDAEDELKKLEDELKKLQAELKKIKSKKGKAKKEKEIVAKEEEYDEKEEEYDDYRKDLITSLKQNARWYKEFDKQGYVDTVEPKMVGVYDNEQYRTTSVTGVATGKDFSITQHGHQGKYVSKKLNYILAEIRRNDNEINTLVKKDAISTEERKRIAKIIQDIQTPF